MSWTPKEYFNFIKGAQHRNIDEYERMASAALMNRKAQNKKRVKMNDLFNAKQARHNLNNGIKDNDKDIERMVALNGKFKGFKPDFIPKGGRT